MRQVQRHLLLNTWVGTFAQSSAMTCAFQSFVAAMTIMIY